MKVTRDEPGRLLVLEEDVERLPAATLPILLAIPGGVMLIVAGPGIVHRVAALRSDSSAGALEWATTLGPAFLFGLLPLVAIGIAFAAAAGPCRLFSVDAGAGEMRVVRRNILTGRDRTETVPLADLTGVRVETLQRTGRGGRSLYRAVASGTSRPNLRLTFLQARRQTLVELPVDALDKPAEAGDFASRLGAAAGLGWQRVLRSDPQSAEIELARDAGAEFQPTPLARESADYRNDVVAPAAAAAVAEERIPPFDGRAFDSTHGVTTWRPGELVRLDKPLGAPAIGCLPFVAVGFLAGPAVLVAPTNATLGGRLVGFLFFGAFGFPIGLIALLAVNDALPRKVVLDWGARLLTAGGLFRRRMVAFADVGALELRCVYTRHHGKHPWDGYKCDLVALVRDPLTAQLADLPLVSTRERTDDPDTPYAQALPLANDLARALGVERRMIPYAK